MLVMVNQILFGKTNHGRKLHGRAARHKEVVLCCVGGLSFYLVCQFFITREFEEFTVGDWLDNGKWFDVKLLVNVFAVDKTKEMSNDSHGKQMRKVLTRLKTFCCEPLHLGRNLGARTLEMLEEDMEEIRRMGNWNPSMFDRSCSAKIPLGPIQKLAGYLNKFCHKRRSTVKPKMELSLLAPIGGWLCDACDGVCLADTECTHPQPCTSQDSLLM